VKSVLVTGVGGMVGQGILRNIRSLDQEIALHGTDIRRVSAGNHLCDSVHVLPYAYDPGYVPAVASLVGELGIALIIPSTDYESYYLARHAAELGATVASSPAEVTAACLDKFKTFETFRAFGIPFADSALPSSYQPRHARVLVKPREGRGSRNIHVDPPHPESFDDSYVVQEYLDGPELTTTFYVTRDGGLHGFITFVRELEAGSTSRCEVTKEHDPEIHRLIEQMLGHMEFRGSCNLQSRVTAAGVIPFEVNCRISGTNSIRSQLGFPDVAYTIDEYLNDRAPQAPQVRGGCAIRVTHDVVYPELTLDEIRDRHDHFRIF
jgi:carbamoyl-phosphate synthase large subunit